MERTTKEQWTELDKVQKVYLKQHNKTKMRYIGSSQAEDIDKYRGSGVLWETHIKEHGNDVKTTVLFQSKYKEDLEAFCSTFCKAMNVVESEIWANLTEEIGYRGSPKGHMAGEEHPFYGLKRPEHSKFMMGNKPFEKVKDMDALRAKMSANHANVSGKNNPMYGKVSAMKGKKNPNVASAMKIRMNKEYLCKYCKKSIKGKSNYDKHHDEKCLAKKYDVLIIKHTKTTATTIVNGKKYQSLKHVCEELKVRRAAMYRIAKVEYE